MNDSASVRTIRFCKRPGGLTKCKKQPLRKQLRGGCFFYGQTAKSPEIKGFRAKRKGRQFLSILPTFCGGEKGIRTLAQHALATAFRVRTLRPLGYLSGCAVIIADPSGKIKAAPAAILCWQRRPCGGFPAQSAFCYQMLPDFVDITGADGQDNIAGFGDPAQLLFKLLKGREKPGAVNLIGQSGG